MHSTTATSTLPNKSSLDDDATSPPTVDLGRNSAVVVGAGLAGSLLAIYLAQRGLSVQLVERRGDMRVRETERGRSINLALSERGITALRGAGILDEIMKIAIPMKGRMIHSTTGEQNLQLYSSSGKFAIYSVSRSELNKKLLDHATKLGVKADFHTKAVHLDTRQSLLLTAFSPEREHKLPVWKSHEVQRIYKANVFFGADGAFSAVRQSLMNYPLFNYSQQYETHGYKELEIPPGPNGTHLLDKNALHIWPRGKYMLIALPNTNGSFTVTFFFPNKSDGVTPGFDSLNTKEKVMDFFKKDFPDAVSLMPTLCEDFFRNPTGYLLTVRCFPWSVGGRLCLLGDAAHAIVPFFGQGMNCAFEDVTVLDECIGRIGLHDGWEPIFHEYEQLRKPNTEAIADMALENYIEMRSGVSDANYLFRKSVAHLLGQHFPERFLTRYELVSFTTVPYAEAKRRGEVNDKIIDELISELSDRDISKVNLVHAKALLDQYYP
jgi:kynurenine 3-monooxygenase